MIKNSSALISCVANGVIVSTQNPSHTEVNIFTTSDELLKHITELVATVKPVKQQESLVV